MLRVAITGAMDNAREVVDFAYHSAGTTANFPGQRVRAPLPRHAYRAGAGTGASVEFRGRRTGAVRRGAERNDYSASPRISRGCDAAGRDALAHDRAAQRSDPVEQIEAEAARALQRQEVGQQAAVEQIDRETAAGHVGATRVLVARGQLVRADVAAVAPRGDDQFADGGGIAQAEIESLRADRRHHMRRLADEDDAIAAEAARDLDRERKHATSGLDRDLAEDANESAARSRWPARRRPAPSGEERRRDRPRRPGLSAVRATAPA